MEESDQLKKIDNNQKIEVNTTVVTPAGVRDEMYLLIKVYDLKDLYGTSWKNSEDITSDVVVFGPYRLGVVSTDNVTITYDSNGGGACNPTSKSVPRNGRWGNLCLPKRKGYTFNGWYTKVDGTDKKIDSSSVADKSITVVAKWDINKLYIRYNVNGATMNKEHSNNITLKKDGTVRKKGKEIIHTIGYGGKLGEDGLLNYNNKKALNVSKSGKCFGGWKAGSKKYNQTTQYAAKKFCDLSEKSCTVTLYANWVKNSLG